MNIQEKKLDHGQLQLTIELAVDELVPYIERAASRLAQTTAIAGFRPGKAPLELVKSHLGEMKIWQEAAQLAVPKTLHQAIQEKHLITVGQPDVTLEKLAPNNPLVFTATMALMPEVTLGKWQALKMPLDEVTVSSEEVDKVVNDFASWQATETIADRPAQLKDKVEVDFEVLVDGVVIEGGKAIKYPMILGSSSMIPGMEEQIIGLKAGEEKEFDLTFPQEYFQASLAGKQARFQVKVVTVMQRNLPIINDDWAQKLVHKTLLEWRQELRASIMADKQAEKAREWENSIMEQIIGVSTFGEIPKTLLANEISKMLHELQHSVEQRRMKWADYLQGMKKTEEQLKQEFEPTATNRVKAALIMRQIAKDSAMTITLEELEQDLAAQEQQYQGNEQALEVVHSPEYKEYMENVLINRKVMQLIRETINTEK
ncbi:MAG: trigger factor [Candidatus Komeilibacteria bacterium]